MTMILSVSNEKGGVAKTTTTISLGAALVEAGLEVLLVDLDAQANLSLALGVEARSGCATTADILLRALPLQPAIYHTGIPRLDLIPASSEMGLVEQQYDRRKEYAATLRRLLRQQDCGYDFVLFDCPPYLGAVTTSALVASDMLLVPTQAEFFSVHALRDMMGVVHQVRANGNPHLTYRLLLTMLDRRNRIHRTMADQLRATFGAGVLDTVIEVDTRLRESPIAGLPIIYHSPKSRAALQYRALAQEMLVYVQKTSSQPS